MASRKCFELNEENEYLNNILKKTTLGNDRVEKDLVELDNVIIELRTAISDERQKIEERKMSEKNQRTIQHDEERVFSKFGQNGSKQLQLDDETKETVADVEEISKQCNDETKEILKTNIDGTEAISKQCNDETKESLKKNDAEGVSKNIMNASGGTIGEILAKVARILEGNSGGDDKKLNYTFDQSTNTIKLEMSASGIACASSSELISSNQNNDESSSTELAANEKQNRIDNSTPTTVQGNSNDNEKTAELGDGIAQSVVEEQKMHCNKDTEKDDSSLLEPKKSITCECKIKGNEESCPKNAKSEDASDKKG